LKVGDRMRVREEGDGRVVFQRIDESPGLALVLPPEH